MAMSRRTNKSIESILLLLFPLALFVGCAGSGTATNTVGLMEFEEMYKPSIENELFLPNDSENAQIIGQDEHKSPLVRLDAPIPGPSQYIFYFHTDSDHITSMIWQQLTGTRPI